MLDVGRKPSQVISVVFYIEISTNCKGQVFPLCDDYFQWSSSAPSIAIARNDHSVGTPLQFFGNTVLSATKRLIEIKFCRNMDHHLVTSKVI